MLPTTDELVGLRPETGPDFSVEDFLNQERGKDLLRFSTAGSVDDGKSTLIGRLLYDTQNVYDDQVRSIEGKGSAGAGQLDLALLTDGLRAEREQGITIDVAYRYFSTANRKFIIADTPGHEQYTRNMATGASTADVAIVLVDARKGVLTQSRRHAYITSLLGVRQVIIAVNKMDLAGYSEATFRAIREDFSSFFAGLDFGEPSRCSAKTVGLYFIPVSALAGDNVVRGSEAMPWYDGPSLLELLESIPTSESVSNAPFRLAVQRVIRPDQNFRSFAGQIASGSIRPGDPIMVLPSRRATRVRSVVTYDGDLAEAQAPLSISLSLEDEIDVSRGDLLVSPNSLPIVASHFSASLVWMDSQPLDTARRYLLKHTSRMVAAQVTALRHRVNIATLENEHSGTLEMNGIGLVDIESLRPLIFDPYSENRRTGSFVLIDSESNATVAAGMIRGVVDSAGNCDEDHPVTPEERRARWGHTGAPLALTGPQQFAEALERALFVRGAFAARLHSADPDVVAALTRAGALAITLEAPSDAPSENTVTVRARSGSAELRALPGDVATAVAETLQILRDEGILIAHEGNL